MIAPNFRFAFFFLLFLAACSNGGTLVETDPDLGYISTFAMDQKTGQHHGPYTKTDSTGTLLEKGILNQGQPDGIRELFYPDGKVKVRERYKAGKLDDLYEYYHPEGTIELKGYYIGGAMYGQWRKYTQDGYLTEEVTMIDNEEMGPFKEYYPNGKIQTEGTYLHGPNEDGRLRLYDESGQLQKEMLCYAGRCYTVWPKD